MKKYFLLLVLVFSSMFASAQIDKILGEWYTVDDETGAVKALVNIYQGDNGLYYGQIIKVFKNGVENPDSDRKGMVIVKDMRAEDGMLMGGTIYEPESGKTYYAKISYNKEDNTITLRGSLDKRGWVGRSQTWIKEKK
ncbi:MAG: DUF2147 domain-containing protein [Bacteroidales bacterium]|nr:DUF2147 domain-containing protein [Bacteroidales bacterium]